MTSIPPDSPLGIPPWIPLILTAAGLIYLVVAIAMAAGGAAGH